MAMALLVLLAVQDGIGADCVLTRDPSRPGNPVVKVDFGCHSDAGDAALARLKDYPEIEEVRLISDVVTDDGLAALALLPRLRVLRLNSGSIGDRGLERLKALKGLQELDLWRCQVGAAGLAHLKAMPELRTLALRRIPIDAEVVDRLRELPALAKLTFSQLSPESRAKAVELVTLLPKASITFAPN